MLSESSTTTLVSEDRIPSKPTEDAGNQPEDGIEDIDDIEESSDSDEEDIGETQDRHEDHWDTIVFRNPWANQWSADWRHNWVRRNEQSLTNGELYEDATTQQWMDGFISLRRDSMSLLIKPPNGSDSCSIPLFQDGNGWQYQVRLGIGDHSLPKMHCPLVLGDQKLWSTSLFELKGRIQAEPAPTAEKVLTPPKLAVPLGKLTVRGDARSPDYFPPGEQVTENTDYSVVMDVDHEDMPLWLLTPRQQLQKRLDNPFYPFQPVRPLTIFESLLVKEDDCGYDCACILSSLRRLGNRPPDPDAPTFQDACDILRKTRAIIDPAALLLPKGKEMDLIGGKPCPDSTELQWETTGGKEEGPKRAQKVEQG